MKLVCHESALRPGAHVSLLEGNETCSLRLLKFITKGASRETESENMTL